MILRGSPRGSGRAVGRASHPAESSDSVEILRPSGELAAIVLESGRGLEGVPKVPAVGEIDADLFVDGDWVELDGTSGKVELPDVREVPVVTALLQREDGRLLLLKRSEAVGTFRGLWAGVSGFIEDPTPRAAGEREVWEETGVASSDLTLRAAGELVCVRYHDEIFAIHPFLFAVRSPQIRLNEEHTTFDWVEPSEIYRRATPPKLGRVWEAVSGPRARREKQ
jgi:8-oxo-dGTP pyrophosphatase MutT (NUDIX family)